MIGNKRTIRRSFSNQTDIDNDDDNNSKDKDASVMLLPDIFYLRRIFGKLYIGKQIKQHNLNGIYNDLSTSKQSRTLYSV